MLGTGTIGDPYRIENSTDLQNMDLHLASHYVLEGNIDCSGIANFEPVGGWNATNPFTGTFDGKNFKISNLVVNRAADDWIGLFGKATGATIQNVTVEATITGDDNVGILVGSSNGGTYSNITTSGTVVGDTDVGGMFGETNDSEVLTNCISSGSVTGTSDTGGLIGETNYHETLTDCSSSCTVSGVRDVGGLIGGEYGDATITRCFATGNVTATGADEGGLIGYLSATTISLCYATGNVTTSDTGCDAGGLIGSAPDSDSEISDCYATGNVTASDVGGNHYVGGLLGYNAGSLTNCYAKGLLTVAGGANEIGGLVGHQVATGSASNCFWDITTSGEADAVGTGDDTGITGHVTATMKLLATFSGAGWDMSKIWNVLATCNSGYPCLIGVNTCCSATQPPVDATIAPKEVSLKLVRNIEMQFGGRFYVDKSGDATYETPYHRPGVTTTHVINNTMASFSFELSDREIYNDVRSEIGISITETVVDEDADYSWRFWSVNSGMPAPGYTTFKFFTASMLNPIRWQLADVSASDSSGDPYYNYNINLQDTNNDLTKAVEIKNTGTLNGCKIKFRVRYKYLSAEEVTSEVTVNQTLTARAYDETTILKYGRRVMSLVWPQGAGEEIVQGLCESNRSKYKEPLGYATLTLIGDSAALRAIIYGAEISDIMTVTDDVSYLPATSFFIESINIDIDINNLNTPFATFGLVEQNVTEKAGVLRFDLGHFDGPEVFG